MSPANNFPVAILDTILGRLALLFLASAGGDLIAARHAASQMLAAYQPETSDEIRLAAAIVSFSLHALEALGQAADPAMSLNQKLRLRGSAVSLSRESHKAQRKLDQLQKARRTGSLAPSAETLNPLPEPVHPRIDKAITLIEATRKTIRTTDKNRSQTWTQGYQQRQAAQRITANLRKNQASQIQPTAAASGAQSAPG